MKKSIFILLFLITMLSISSFAQRNRNSEKYGKTLNLGVGVGGYSGYYGYVGHTLPVFNINYEFDVASSFTLAPFASFYTFTESYYWGNNNYPNKYYTYRQTVIPVGIKGSYYFDKIFEASSSWDFYLAGSLGFAIINSSWDDDYYGGKDFYNKGNPLFLDIHAGVEYHFNNKVGMFLDLSSGVSTIGLAFH
jgi:hypothetical protein